MNFDYFFDAKQGAKCYLLTFRDEQAGKISPIMRGSDQMKTEKVGLR